MTQTTVIDETEGTVITLQGIGSRTHIIECKGDFSLPVFQSAVYNSIYFGGKFINSYILF